MGAREACKHRESIPSFYGGAGWGLAASFLSEANAEAQRIASAFNTSVQHWDQYATDTGTPPQPLLGITKHQQLMLPEPLYPTIY